MRVSTTCTTASLLLLAGAGASPTRHATVLTTDQLLAISPNSSSCANAPAPGECATAAEAAPVINEVFAEYMISTAGEQAALLSLMAFETGDFKYNRNHFPGVPGQGTRNMQSPAFNRQYALSIAEIKDQVSAEDDVSATLDLLLGDARWDFGSAAWFLTTQCSDAVRQGLRQGDEAGWEAYISQCVGATVTDERTAYWRRATNTLF
ncbi:hypothetical protein PISL3812_05858 [Talaromyces islandicus]|uniref:Uncharacterized protein n=1 Tax=Talaromyces islandicus TaxID=28573 RepID=A0A0U1LZU5_TALIS|nr:hypothetical protein PISL3812_05858 [Talaromyces islandicus]